jgi:hypothetical protein
MTKQAMAELVAEIERRGYIQRTTDQADRRAKIIGFTGEGWAIVRLALSALGELEAEIVGRLGEPSVRQPRCTARDPRPPGLRAAGGIRRPRVMITFPGVPCTDSAVWRNLPSPS